MAKGEKWVSKTEYKPGETINDVRFESRSYRYGPDRDYMIINEKAYPVTKKTISTLRKAGIIK